MDYKVVMLGVNENDNITMKDNLTKEQAIKIKAKCEQKDSIHYFEIKEIKK